MERARESEGRARSWERWVPALAVCLAWSLVTAAAVAMLRREQGLVVAALALAALAVTLVAWTWADDRPWVRPIGRLARRLGARAEDPRPAEELAEVPELIRAGRATPRGEPRPVAPPHDSGEVAAPRPLATMTRSGLFESPPGSDGFETSPSGEFPTTEMVSRLEPTKLRWIESSPAEQAFLGWDIH